MPEQDLGKLTSRVSTAMVIIALLAVVLRFFARKWSKTGYQWDDWFALASLPFTLGISISFYFAVAHGYGTPTGDTLYYYRVIYVDEILWFTSFLFTKLSVLFFYNRVFGSKPILRMTLYAIGAFTILWWIIITLMAIFQCKPVTGSIVALPSSKCFPALPFFYAQTIPNILTDFAILLVPMPILAKLQMRLPKKLGLLLIFTVGYFVPILSIVRIVYFVKLHNTPGKHSAYQTALSTIWSILETAFALVGACIPTLTIVARRSLDFASRSFSSLISFRKSSRSTDSLEASTRKEKEDLSERSAQILDREGSMTSSYPTTSKSDANIHTVTAESHEGWRAC